MSSQLEALQAENLRLKAENARLQAALQAQSTDQDLLRTLGRSPDRGRSLIQSIGQRSLSPGSELERRPGKEDNTENELAQFLEEGLRDGLFSNQEQQPGDLLDDIIRNIPVKKLRKPYTCEDRASELGIDADEEELPDWLKEGLQPEIPKHLKHAFREARKKKKKPLPRLLQGAKINPLAQTILAKKAAMRFADKARAKRDKAPWSRGTLQFHSLAAPQTLRKLPDIVHGKPYPITIEDAVLVWPDLAELVNDICVKSGVLVSDPQGFPLSFLDELQKRFRRDNQSDSLDEFESTGKSNGYDMQVQCLILPPGYETRLHGHVSMELCYVLSGSLHELRLCGTVPTLAKDEEPKVPLLDLTGLTEKKRHRTVTRCGDIPERAVWKESTIELGEYIHNDVGSVHQIKSGSDGASLLLLWCGLEEPYTSDRILCGDELRLASPNDKPPKLRLFEGTWVPPKGIQYFSIDDQIIEEMKAECLIEERRPTEAPVVVEEDPHARFDERAGLLNSKHWRRAEGEKAPSPRRTSDDHLRGSWGSLHEVRGTDDDAVGEVVDAAIEKAMSPPKNNV
jgi:hypothetical protein